MLKFLLLLFTETLIVAVVSAVSTNPAPAQKYEPCVDLYLPQCKTWKEQSMCNLSSYKEYMMRTCPMSCGLCDQDSQNKENHPQIPVTTKPDINPKPVLTTMPPGPQYSIQSFKNEPQMPPIVTEVKEVEPNQDTQPQAMRLIESLTQMISQSSGRRNVTTGVGETRSKKGKGRFLTHKKHKLEQASRKPKLLIPVSRRTEVESLDESDDLDVDENTLRAIIQARKRSSINKKRSHKKTTARSAPSSKSQTKQDRSHNTKNETKLPSTEFPSVPEEVEEDQPVSPHHSQDPDSIKEDYDSTEPDQPQDQAENFEQQLTQYQSEDSTEAPTITTTASDDEDEQVKMTTILPIAHPFQGSGYAAQYSIIIKQEFTSAYADSTSSAFRVLKGNVVQDLEYTLGPDATISEVTFERASDKSLLHSYTKVTFVIEGSLENMDKLRKQVGKGDVNGLKVEQNSLKDESQ